MPEPTGKRNPRLIDVLALSTGVLIAAGSLYPFAGWQDNGLPPWSFLAAGWPRYWTQADLLVNVGAYVPLGLLLGLAARRRCRITATVALALAASALLSLSVELLQHYLPSRIPSKFDLLCNLLGALAGVGLAVWKSARFLAFEDRLEAMLNRAPHPALGLALIALWLLAQLSPDAVFATSGDLRRLLGFEGLNVAGGPRLLESATVAAHVAVIGLLINRLFGDVRPALPMVVLCLLLAASAASVARAAGIGPNESFSWLTEATLTGLLFGALGLLLSLLLPNRAYRTAALVWLAAGVAAINALPLSPYAPSPYASWHSGPYLNIIGLIRWIGILWPLLAAFWLLAGPWQKSRWQEGLFRRSL